MNLFFFSFGSTGGVLIGHELGAEEVERSKNYAWRLLRLIFLSGLALCPIFVLLRDAMLLPFPNLSAGAAANVRSALLIISFFIWARGVNFSNMNGILRSGGVFTAAVRASKLRPCADVGAGENGGFCRPIVGVTAVSNM